jgi:hypothetical protein
MRFLGKRILNPSFSATIVVEFWVKASDASFFFYIFGADDASSTPLNFIKKACTWAMHTTHCFFHNSCSINFMCVGFYYKFYMFFYYKFILIEKFIKHDQINYPCCDAKYLDFYFSFGFLIFIFVYCWWIFFLLFLYTGSRHDEYIKYFFFELSYK